MNGDCISARARAKVNLFLEVVGKRADGYHDIDSVFVEIDLADEISARANDSGRVTLVCDDPSLPTDERNIAVRAALAVREAGGNARDGLEIRLKKRIPCGGGLGGGSSDAAEVLRLADRLWRCGLEEDGTLHSLAAGLGSDVPFFLRGGACRCRGRGEIIEPLPPFSCTIGLALPPVHSPTAAAYKNLRLPAPGAARSADAFIAAMARGDVPEMRELAFNRFEESVFRDLPRLGRLHAELEALLGHSVRMSGSGAALWFFAEPGWQKRDGVAAWAEANGVSLA